MVCQTPVALLYRPVNNAARVGEQVGEAWKSVRRTPVRANWSMLGVRGPSGRQKLKSSQLTSSGMMSSTLGRGEAVEAASGHEDIKTQQTSNSSIPANRSLPGSRLSGAPARRGHGEESREGSGVMQTLLCYANTDPADGKIGFRSNERHLLVAALELNG